MPRGRMRQTPAEAWRESESRILMALREYREGKGFNELQAETKLSPTTLSQHLGRLVQEGWAYRNPRTGGYYPTKEGDQWLDLSAVIQRMINMAGQAGAVGPFLGGPPGAEATSVYALPSPGTGALARLGNELPPRLLEVLLLDLVNRGLARKPNRSRVPGVGYTRGLLRRFPRILVLEIDWDGWAAKLDSRDVHDAWATLLPRLSRRRGRGRRRPRRAKVEAEDEVATHL